MSNPRTQQDWQAMAGTLSIRTQAFIDGKYVDAASGKTFDCVSPIDGRVLGQVADGQEEDINRAVAAAPVRGWVVGAALPLQRCLPQCTPDAHS